jgi:hypothetical protein
LRLTLFKAPAHAHSAFVLTDSSDDQAAIRFSKPLVQ